MDILIQDCLDAIARHCRTSGVGDVVTYPTETFTEDLINSNRWDEFTDAATKVAGKFEMGLIFDMMSDIIIIKEIDDDTPMLECSDEICGFIAHCDEEVRNLKFEDTVNVIYPDPKFKQRMMMADEWIRIEQYLREDLYYSCYHHVGYMGLILTKRTVKEMVSLWFDIHEKDGVWDYYIEQMIEDIPDLSKFDISSVMKIIELNLPKGWFITDDSVYFDPDNKYIHLGLTGDIKHKQMYEDEAAEIGCWYDNSEIWRGGNLMLYEFKRFVDNKKTNEKIENFLS